MRHEKSTARAPRTRHGTRTAPRVVRQDSRPVRGDRDGVLEMGRKRAVDGRDRPVVVVDVDVGAAGGDHRLDRERHALAQHRAAARRDEVRHLRVLVVASGRRRGRRGCGRPRSRRPRPPSGRRAEMSPTGCAELRAARSRPRGRPGRRRAAAAPPRRSRRRRTCRRSRRSGRRSVTPTSTESTSPSCAR